MELIKEKAPAGTEANRIEQLNNLSSNKGTENLSIADIEADIFNAETLLKKPSSGLFLLKKANQWIDEAKSREIPKQLCRELWYEGELCISFADSNSGKSIHAVQVGVEIAEQHPDEMVAYLDFELSDKQFEARYGQDFTNHYIFPDNFYRAEMDPDGDYEIYGSFEEGLMYSLEQLAISGVKIFIIDNITYLKDETDKAKNALPLMKQLKALKKKYNLSILVLAHTPKRDMTKPLTQNDLGGSKMIMNFCDSAFAIGVSQRDSTMRYIKQVKVRNTENKYHAENVMVYQITKPTNFLFMMFIGFGCEREHLKVITEKDKDELKLKVKELAEKGWSQRQISSEIGIAVGTVNKYLHS